MGRGREREREGERERGRERGREGEGWRERERGRKRIKTGGQQSGIILTCRVICENKIENSIGNELCLITRGSLVI